MEGRHPVITALAIDDFATPCLAKKEKSRSTSKGIMKVCINFGDIRCVVPVGDGSLTVKEVIDLAVERFRKATAKVRYCANTGILISTTTSMRTISTGFTGLSWPYFAW